MQNQTVTKLNVCQNNTSLTLPELRVEGKLHPNQSLPHATMQCESRGIIQHKLQHLLELVCIRWQHVIFASGLQFFEKFSPHPILELVCTCAM